MRVDSLLVRWIIIYFCPYLLWTFTVLLITTTLWMWMVCERRLACLSILFCVINYFLRLSFVIYELKAKNNTQNIKKQKKTI